jgi:hypothetical protein
MLIAEIGVKQARRRLAVAQDDLREATHDDARARLERKSRIAEARILHRALAGPSISGVVREGDKAERAFLPELREQLMHELQAETEECRGEPTEQEAAAPQRPSRESRRLRGYIERIDRATCHPRSRHACAAPASRQLSEPRPIQACPRLRFPCGQCLVEEPPVHVISAGGGSIDDHGRDTEHRRMTVGDFLDWSEEQRDNTPYELVAGALVRQGRCLLRPRQGRCFIPFGGNRRCSTDECSASPRRRSFRS